MKYDILIPAYNAETTIKILLSEINKLDKKPEKIIIIDDGSKDETAAVSKKMNAIVIQLERNQGKGKALKTGYDYFINNSENEYIICMDADLQHPVSSIPDFLATAYNKKYQLIIGYRKRVFNKMPLHRILSNTLTSLILSIFTKQKIMDSQCGYRMIHKDLLKVIKMDKNDFQLESEMILRASEKKVKIEFIEIPTIYNKQKSHINNINVTYKFILLVLKEIKNIIFRKTFTGRKS